jgi:hypothetical protein
VKNTIKLFGIIVLLVGLIVSCDGEGNSEPQYQVIASVPCTKENYAEVWDDVWYKHMGGVGSSLGMCDKSTAIMGEAKRNAMWDELIYKKKKKKPSTADELIMVLKVDVYRVIGRVMEGGNVDLMIWGYIYNN